MTRNTLTDEVVENRRRIETVFGEEDNLLSDVNTERLSWDTAFNYTTVTTIRQTA